MKPLAARSVLIALVAAVAMAGAALALRDRGGGAPLRAPSSAFVASVRGERAVLWAVGDGADGGAAGKAIAARIARGRMDRLLYLGDVYGGGGLASDGTAADYRNHYGALYGRLAERTAPTPGNHEWPQRTEGYNPYWTKVHGRALAYYAFTAGGWRILSLNSEAPHGAGSAQLRWLRGQLRRRGTCRLAFWHRPRFSAGPHGDQPDVAPLWNALAGRAALVISGHDHDMQRLRPIDGVTQVVSGAGGHGHYPVKSADRRVAFSNDRGYGALRITLRPGRASLAFVSDAGQVLDRHRVRCKAV